MKKRHISLKDLASEIGVSISTVSRALKNHPDISPEITAKIRQLAQDRNYMPNPLAMGLLKHETRMIGVIVPDIVTHFYASIISGIEEVARERGHYIVIASSGESIEKEREALENLMKTRVDGIIICLSRQTSEFDHFHRLVEMEIPLVFFDRVAENMAVPSVTVDGAEAARQITCHFYQNGRRRIAYISGPDHLNISQQRKAGYLAGLNECGLKFEPQLLTNCNLDTSDAALAAQYLLRLQPLPDAIFGINDTVAFAAMKEIRKQGLKIPEDIALVGFTDEFHATVVEPALTSVTHPTQQMGREAARLFFNRVEQGPAYTEKVVLPTSLVIRESSGAN